MIETRLHNFLHADLEVCEDGAQVLDQVFSLHPNYACDAGQVLLGWLAVIATTFKIFGKEKGCRSKKLFEF